MPIVLKSFTWLSVVLIGNLAVTSVSPSAAPSGNKTLRPVATPTTSRKTTDADTPPTEAWTTQESRDILGGFFIKPYLQQRLKDPDSLQDFRVVNAKPTKKLPGSFDVLVFYRARNSFGALVAEQRTVTMVYNPTDENHPWVMIP